MNLSISRINQATGVSMIFAERFHFSHSIFYGIL